MTLFAAKLYFSTILTSIYSSFIKFSAIVIANFLNIMSILHVFKTWYLVTNTMHAYVLNIIIYIVLILLLPKLLLS